MLIEDEKFFLSQMGLTKIEFDNLMNLPIRKHTFYPSYTVALNVLLKIAIFVKRNIFFMK